MSYFLSSSIDGLSQTPAIPSLDSAFIPPARDFASPPREPIRGQLVFFAFSRYFRFVLKIEPSPPYQVLKALTINLRTTYCGSDSLGSEGVASMPPAPPPVVFTEPSEPVSNDGFDNVENNLILRAHDHITSPEGKE